MLKYFIFLFMALTCLASEPKFHYMDCVQIVKGFYKDCTGNVTSYDEDNSSYTVEIDACKSGRTTLEVSETDLKGCKK